MSLIQNELDIAEQNILNLLFQDYRNPQVNGMIVAFLRLKGLDHLDYINSTIRHFEEFMLPLMKDNGMVDSKKLVEVIGAFYPPIQNIQLEDFRPIDAVRVFEKPLAAIGNLLR